MSQIKLGLYKIIRWIVKLCYPKIEVVGLENLPEEPCLVVGNHAQMNGPIAGELYFPGPHCIWCAGEMMYWSEVPDYAFRDFWSRKPKAVRWFYRLLSYLITPLSVIVFGSGPCIEVRHDRRVVHTLRQTAEKLAQGNSVIIFPEHDAPYDHILCDFQEGFVTAAKTYWKQTGKEVLFLPMYLAPTLKKMYLGKPIRFRSDAPIQEERRRICQELMAEISRMACALPRHRVVPYNNIPKKDYGYNIPPEVTDHEETRC